MSARPISKVAAIVPFTRTQAITTSLDAARTSPAPVGRLIIAKVRRLLVAPPVKTQP